MKKSLLSLLFFTSAIISANAAITQIRWGSTADPLNGLTITWSNTGTKDSIKWGYTTKFEKGSFVSTSRTGYTSGTLFFKYTFPSVTGSSTIYYELYDSKTSSWGSQMTFKTAPPVNTKTFSFGVLGDCRDYPATLTTISNLVSARNPSFCLFNGDLTLSGNSATQYNTFFSAASNFLANNLAYQAEGNHDAASPSMFSNLWDLPVTNGTNLYYATKYGNAIFITINTNTPTDAAQLTWIQNTLKAAAADPTILWKIVSDHHAWFTDGSHNGDMDAYRGTIWKAFDDYGVDMVFTGHDHNYQRSLPVNLNVSSTKPVSQYGSGSTQGRLQIVSGGAGAGLYAQSSTNDAWALTVFNQSYNYTFVKVNGCKVQVYAYDNNNAIIDSVILDKTGTPACITTGIADAPELHNVINVYPNPNTGHFTFHYSAEYIGKATIKIYDLAGREIKTEEVNKTEQEFNYTFNMSSYAPGVYNISIIAGDHKDNAEFILSR